MAYKAGLCSVARSRSIFSRSMRSPRYCYYYHYIATTVYAYCTTSSGGYPLPTRRTKLRTFVYRHSSSRSERLPHLINVILPDLHTNISSSSLLGGGLSTHAPFAVVLFVYRVEYPLFHSDSVVDRTEGDLPLFAFDLPRKRPRRKCRNLMRNSRLNFS